MDLEKCRYIVVEGPIGAGKTSLARAARGAPRRRRAARAPARTIRSSRASTRTCRATRCRRSSCSCSSASTSCAASAQLDLFRRATVADFLLDKDPLFARLNLSDDEYALYEKIYAHLKPQAPTPDLVIYLQAPVETLIERVHRRGVDYERTISADYLARLADAYSRYFYQYDAAPLLIVNSERLNFVDDADHFELLLARIGAMRGRREFFNLGQTPEPTHAPYTAPSDAARRHRAVTVPALARDGARRHEDRDAHLLRRELRRAAADAPASTCCWSAIRSAW